MDCRLSHSFSITNSRGAASLKDFASELAPHIRAVELEEALKADTIILAVMYTTVPEVDGGARHDLRPTPWHGRARGQQPAVRRPSAGA